ncbi:high affinity copper uptake protein 1-like [Sycon ciliatum]|uniref:high affinity copper uptake protein 1-like n=1 Tax=Sycon ciliatum TaxID=27933 RepID=UPI0031F71FEC
MTGHHHHHHHHANMSSNDSMVSTTTMASHPHVQTLAGNVTRFIATSLQHIATAIAETAAPEYRPDDGSSSISHHHHHHNHLPAVTTTMGNSSGAGGNSHFGHDNHHPSTGSPGGMDHGAGGHMGGHSPYFFFSTDSTILFKGWQTHDVGSLIGSMVAVFVIAFLFEGIRTLRECMAARADRRFMVRTERSKNAVSVMYRWSLSDTLIQTGLHMLFFTWSYLLMLIFMVFNVWLCIAVVLGVGAGYITFLRFRPGLLQRPGVNLDTYHPAEDECCA